MSQTVFPLGSSKKPAFVYGKKLKFSRFSISRIDLDTSLQLQSNSKDPYPQEEPVSPNPYNDFTRVNERSKDSYPLVGKNKDYLSSKTKYVDRIRFSKPKALNPRHLKTSKEEENSKTNYSAFVNPSVDSNASLNKKEKRKSFDVKNQDLHIQRLQRFYSRKKPEIILLKKSVKTSPTHFQASNESLSLSSNSASSFPSPTSKPSPINSDEVLVRQDSAHISLNSSFSNKDYDPVHISPGLGPEKTSQLANINQIILTPNSKSKLSRVTHISIRKPKKSINAKNEPQMSLKNDFLYSDIDLNPSINHSIDSEKWDLVDSPTVLEKTYELPTLSSNFAKQKENLEHKKYQNISSYSKRTRTTLLLNKKANEYDSFPKNKRKDFKQFIRHDEDLELSLHNEKVQIQNGYDLNQDLKNYPTINSSKHISLDKREFEWDLDQSEGSGAEDTIANSKENPRTQSAKGSSSGEISNPRRISGPLIRARALKNISYKYGNYTQLKNKSASSTSTSNSRSIETSSGLKTKYRDELDLLGSDSEDFSDTEQVLWKNPEILNTQSRNLLFISDKTNNNTVLSLNNTNFDLDLEHKGIIQDQIDEITDELSLNANTKSYPKYCLKLATAFLNVFFCKLVTQKQNCLKLFNVLNLNLQKSQISSFHNRNLESGYMAFILLVMVTMHFNPKLGYDLILKHRCLEKVGETILYFETSKNEEPPHNNDPLVYSEKSNSEKTTNQLYYIAKEILLLVDGVESKQHLGLDYLALSLLYNLAQRNSPAALVMNELVRLEFCASGCINQINDFVLNQVLPCISSYFMGSRDSTEFVSIYYHKIEKEIHILKMYLETVEFVSLSLISDPDSETLSTIKSAFQLEEIVPSILYLIFLLYGISSSHYSISSSRAKKEFNLSEGLGPESARPALSQVELEDSILLANDLILCSFRVLLNFAIGCNQTSEILQKSQAISIICKVGSLPNFFSTVFPKPHPSDRLDNVGSGQVNETSECENPDFRRSIFQQYNDILVISLSLIIAIAETDLSVLNDFEKVLISEKCSFHSHCLEFCSCDLKENFLISLCNGFYLLDNNSSVNLANTVNKPKNKISDFEIEKSSSNLGRKDQLNTLEPENSDFNTFFDSHHEKNHSSSLYPNAKSNSILYSPENKIKNPKNGFQNVSFLRQVLIKQFTPQKQRKSFSGENGSEPRLKYSSVQILKEHMRYLLFLVFSGSNSSRLFAKKSLDNSVYLYLLQLLSKQMGNPK
ncbi:hypothetical protein BB560_000911 [Smittium megazygosporum]|uniref:Uncharacterized protein n=1 Tax=Smittium megazygosporum TaxID=133381 RepID=A0A2T9ZJ25_9FUNG|nr:hypothetical protein BB560_000911 [Smittium megazygosporum]